MSEKENDLFYKTQITVFKTNKALIEAIDKLVPTDKRFAPHIHAGAEDKEWRQQVKSRIGIRMVDYSNGTGDKALWAEANLEPVKLKEIRQTLMTHTGNYKYQFTQSKIWGHEVDKDGRSPVTILSIARSDKTADNNGNPIRNSWFVQIQNGTGVAAKNKTGGTYMQANSYQEETKCTIQMSDSDFFAFIENCYTYLCVWELSIGGALLKSYYNWKKTVQDTKELMEDNTPSEADNAFDKDYPGSSAA